MTDHLHSFNLRNKNSRNYSALIQRGDLNCLKANVLCWRIRTINTSEDYWRLTFSNNGNVLSKKQESIYIVVVNNNNSAVYSNPVHQIMDGFLISADENRQIH